jgi:ABC-2 type transport system permease protein
MTSAIPRPGLPARPTKPTSTTAGDLRGAVAFEWTKLFTVRSTWWSLIAVGVLTVGVSIIVGMSVTASAKKGIDAAQPAPHAAVGAIMLAQLAVVVLAALPITSEYATRSITTTLQSVPVRGRMLASKVMVVAGVAFATGLLATAIGTLSAMLAMGEYGRFTAGQATATAFGVATYLAALASIAVGVGALMRSAAGTITTMIMLLLAIPQILGFVGAEWARRTGDFLPDAAGAVLMTQGTDPYRAEVALAVLILWAAAATATGYTALRMRDA